MSKKKKAAIFNMKPVYKWIRKDPIHSVKRALSHVKCETYEDAKRFCDQDPGGTCKVLVDMDCNGRCWKRSPLDLTVLIKSSTSGSSCPVVPLEVTTTTTTTTLIEVTCNCTSVNSLPGLNQAGFRCSDGSTGKCKESESCVAKNGFAKANLRDACQVRCSCFDPGSKFDNRYRCSDDTISRCQSRSVCSQSSFFKNDVGRACQPLDTADLLQLTTDEGNEYSEEESYATYEPPPLFNIDLKEVGDSESLFDQSIGLNDRSGSLDEEEAEGEEGSLDRWGQNNKALGGDISKEDADTKKGPTIPPKVSKERKSDAVKTAQTRIDGGSQMKAKLDALSYAKGCMERDFFACKKFGKGQFDSLLKFGETCMNNTKVNPTCAVRTYKERIQPMLKHLKEFVDASFKEDNQIKVEGDWFSRVAKVWLDTTQSMTRGNQKGRQVSEATCFLEHQSNFTNQAAKSGRQHYFSIARVLLAAWKKLVNGPILKSLVNAANTALLTKRQEQSATQKQSATDQDDLFYWVWEQQKKSPFIDAGSRMTKIAESASRKQCQVRMDISNKALSKYLMKLQAGVGTNYAELAKTLEGNTQSSLSKSFSAAMMKELTSVIVEISEKLLTPLLGAGIESVHNHVPQLIHMVNGMAGLIPNYGALHSAAFSSMFTIASKLSAAELKISAAEWIKAQLKRAVNSLSSYAEQLMTGQIGSDRKSMLRWLAPSNPVSQIVLSFMPLIQSAMRAGSTVLFDCNARLGHMLLLTQYYEMSSSPHWLRAAKYTLSIDAKRWTSSAQVAVMDAFFKKGRKASEALKIEAEQRALRAARKDEDDYHETQLETTTPLPSELLNQKVVEFGPWGACSAPCGPNRKKERKIYCYQGLSEISTKSCNALLVKLKVTNISCRHALPGAYPECQLGACPNTACTTLDPKYDTGLWARNSYNKTRCKSPPGKPRKPLIPEVEFGGNINEVNVMGCANACAKTKGCTFFSIMRLPAGKTETELPWCLAEDTQECMDSAGIVADEMWDLYRTGASLPKKIDLHAPAKVLGGSITSTTVWHYRNSVLVNDNFIPPFIPDQPSAPVAVSRGSSYTTAADAGSEWLKLAWDPPQNENGSPIMSYKILQQFWQPVETPSGKTEYRERSHTSQSFGPTTQNIVVSDLVAGRYYTFAVAATNEEGTSQWSQSSYKVRMGSIHAKANPEDIVYSAGTQVTVKLSIKATTPVKRAVMMSVDGKQQADCAVVHSANLYEEFTCLTPEYKSLEGPSMRQQDRMTPQKWSKGIMKAAKIVAYDVANLELAVAKVTYVPVSCPRDSKFQQITLPDAKNGYETETCQFIARQDPSRRCEVCRCTMGFEAGTGWDGSGDKTKLPSTANATCVPKDSYCRPISFSNGQIKGSYSIGAKISKQDEVCEPGYELREAGAGSRKVIDPVKCIAKTVHNGAFGVLGRPVELTCSRIEDFCRPVNIPGGSIGAGLFSERKRPKCLKPETWPFDSVSKASVQNVVCQTTEDGNRVRGGWYAPGKERKVTLSAPPIECGGCPVFPLANGKVKPARIGATGQIECQAGFKIFPPLKPDEFPKCSDRVGDRKDSLKGKWTWQKGVPKCEEDSVCKDYDCGEHGICQVKLSTYGAATGTDGIKKEKPWCMCRTGWYGDKCQNPPPQKCEFKLLWRETGTPERVPATNSIAEKLKAAVENVIDEYEGAAKSDNVDEMEIVRALELRKSKLKNVKACCLHTSKTVQVDVTVKGKGGDKTEKRDRQKKGEHNLEVAVMENLKAIPSNSVADALESVMDQADSRLGDTIRDRLKEMDVRQDNSQLELKSFEATLVVPVDTPPIGACLPSSIHR
eukprot:TRINITY_DN18174_c0_g1_i1.p1 TRINITY_DN18174_c0_g1~~TRINITY_DN18174_c0_g1_i1.p1  ORF type:complete len:1951 (-),score=334.00 TRINITY_DN18174_c0_g1_i1:538-6027(-)